MKYNTITKPLVLATILTSSVLATAQASERGDHMMNMGERNKSGVELQERKGRGMEMMHDANKEQRPVVMGSVTSISGTSIIVTSGTSTYTVDASGATITKTGVATSTISNIVVGDMVHIFGTVTGTSVKATKIMDGVMGGMGEMMRNDSNRVMGQVISVSGGTFVVQKTLPPQAVSTSTTTSSVTVVTNSSTKFMKGDVTGTISDVAANQKVSVFGTFDTNTKTLTASEVRIMVVPTVQSSSTTPLHQNTEMQKQNFFSKVGSFFKRFGF